MLCCPLSATIQKLHSLASTISKVCTGLALRGGTRGIQNPAAKMNLNAIDPQCTVIVAVGGECKSCPALVREFPFFPHTPPHTSSHHLHMYGSSGRFVCVSFDSVRHICCRSVIAVAALNSQNIYTIINSTNAIYKAIAKCGRLINAQCELCKII